MTPEPALADDYDVLLFDLDGVVHVGDSAVPGAPEALRELKRRGVALCYVTNNASRGARQVAELLTSLGAPAEADEVMTSAQASARMLAERLAPGASVLIVGTEALSAEVTAAGLRPVRSADDKPAAVVQGHSPETGWAQLAEAAVALTDGALWVATNPDRTLPSPRGPLPGNGALVAALATAAGRQPDLVVGKPAPELFEAAVRERAARRPLVIGDRLDTDIEGAVRAGCESLFVLTGVGVAADLLTAGEDCRPRYVADGLADLLTPYPQIVSEQQRARCRQWTATADGENARLDGDGAPIDALRALCAVVWWLPHGGRSPTVTADSPPASQALDTLGLLPR
ncbi:MAG: HAD-IIA family hydrolase [Micromonosporaceae bacterium]|nr:HAD-IIA family hydrolase [Micromonosporaceae bacterium]